MAADLDSNNAFEGEFCINQPSSSYACSTEPTMLRLCKGPEKLLEVWFSASANCLPIATAPEGLMIVPAAVWKDMLDLVNCEVLSIIESEDVNASIQVQHVHLSS